MSVMGPENNPEAIYPEIDVFIGAVEDSLRALRNDDYEIFGHAAGAIKQYPSPFAADKEKFHGLVVELGRDYLKEHTEENSKAHQDRRKNALAVILRSYTYAGVEIDAALVYMTADYVGVDKKWLRESLRPTPKMLFANKVHTQDRKVVRRIGHRVMEDLDLVPHYGNRLMKIFDSTI